MAKAMDHSAGIHITRLFSFFNLVRVLVIVIIASLAGALIVVFKLDRDLTAGYTEAIVGISRAEHALFSTMIYSGLFQLFVAVSALSLAAIFYSHKVIGPLYRFTVVFRDMAEGKIRGDTKIRKRDQLQSTTEALNTMKAGVRGFVDELKGEADEIEKLIEELGRAGEPGRSAMEARLRERIASFNRAVGKAKLKR